MLQAWRHSKMWVVKSVDEDHFAEFIDFGDGWWWFYPFAEETAVECMEVVRLMEEYQQGQ